MGNPVVLKTNGTVRVPPHWQILSPDTPADAATIPVRLVPGPGFGDGRHPTTQLCLQAISALAPRDRPWRMLDFGSGSGVLSIAAAHLGATVHAVEIDANAVAHAERNFAVNGVMAQVRQSQSLAGAPGPFDLTIANILRGVLLAFALPLVQHARGGTLLLSGLVSTDVPEVIARYAPLLDGARPDIHECEEWRALVWRGCGRLPLPVQIP